MSLSLILACLWLVLANLLGLLPSRNDHWRRAWGLIVTGLPLLVWVTWAHGVFAGSVFLAAGASVLRWPVYFLWLWVRQLAR